MYIADLHCDTVYRIKDGEHGGLYSIKDSHLDLSRMKASGYMLQTFAAFVDTARYPNGWETCLSLIDKINREIDENRSLISRVLCAEDLSRNIENGLMSALISVEEGGVIGEDTDKIKILHSLGVRMMTLTWNHKNSLASPAFDCDLQSSEFSSSEGLTKLGFEAVSEMEAQKIIIDVSHLSDRGFYDIAENFRVPFIASHSNTRKFCDVPRNLTDDMINVIGERGGLVGLNYYADFIGGAGGFDRLAHHAAHIAKIGGVECIALGSDFDGIELNPLIPDCTAVPDFRNNLRSVGFSESEVDLIMGGNVKRFLRENL